MQSWVSENAFASHIFVVQILHQHMHTRIGILHLCTRQDVDEFVRIRSVTTNSATWEGTVLKGREEEKEERDGASERERDLLGTAP